SRYGHRRAATRPRPSLVKSPSGVPPSAWTHETDDPPEQGSCRLRPSSGNKASTDASPTQATTRRIATCEGTRLPREPPKTTTATTDITPGGQRSTQRRYRRGLADRRATVKDSSVGRALQVLGRNSRARVITGQPKLSLRTRRAV